MIPVSNLLAASLHQTFSNLSVISVHIKMLMPYKFESLELKCKCASSFYFFSPAK